MARDIMFRVNGTAAHVALDDDVPLLHALRNVLGLKATRFGCGEEQCGACMVLVDGRPAFSCTLPVGDVEGRSVETAEAVADGGHPLHAAFVAEQAGQCGYCLSGILMSAKALLDRNPAPSRADIVAALEPHLCRCGAHGRIIRAVEAAAGSLEA